MKCEWTRWVAGTALLALAVSSLSCMHDRKLVGITIKPSSATFLTPDPTGQIQYTALGQYIHPPDNRDITDQVTWKTDVQNLVSVDHGLVSPVNGGCGVANISASMKEGGNLVISFATVTVEDPTVAICPGGSTAQGVVTVAITGSGTVTSVPGGINCPTGACGAQFNVGETIVLTATPTNGATSVNWSGCTDSSGTTCSVVVTTQTTNTTATFN